MSKLQELPTQKGAELFPNNIQAPTKLVILGVGPDNTAAARAIAEQFGGQIKQFHAKQQRMYALSENQIQRGYAQWPGARAQYTNIMGQETIVVEVSAEVIEKIQKSLVSTPWDWAVVDFQVPLFAHSYPGDADPTLSDVRFYAEQDRPPVDTSEPKFTSYAEIGAASDGASIWYWSAEKNPVLQWAAAISNYPQAGGDMSDNTTTRTCSLLIDIRGFHNYEEVIFNVYGSLDPMADNVTYRNGAQVAWASIQFSGTPDEMTDLGGNPTPATLTATTGVVPSGTPNPYAAMEYVDNSAEPTDYPIHGPLVFNGVMPDFDAFYGLPIDHSTTIVVDIPQGLSFLTNNLGATIVWEFHENVVHYQMEKIFEQIPIVTPVNPTASLNIRSAMFRGEPRWGWSSYAMGATGIVSSSWELVDKFPSRFATGPLKTGITMTKSLSADLGVANNCGLSFLGKIRVYPKKGGVVFSSTR